MNGLIVLAGSMFFGDIRRLWKMTLSSNWLLWNEHNGEVFFFSFGGGVRSALKMRALKTQHAAAFH